MSEIITITITVPDGVAADIKMDTGGASTKADDTPKSNPELKRLADKMKAAVKEHGEDFVKQCLDDVGAPEANTLPKRLAAVDEKDYDDLNQLLDEPPIAVSGEAVVEAMRKFVKENSKDAAQEILAKYDLRNPMQVKRCEDAEVLAKLFAEFS